MPQGSEQTPLLGNEAGEAGAQRHANATSLDQSARKVRRNRLISLGVSIFIIVVFVVILILAGGKSYTQTERAHVSAKGSRPDGAASLHANP